MKIDKMAPYYIKAYLTELPCLLIHESSHYIVALIIRCLGLAPGFPIMRITRKFRIEYKDDCDFMTYGWCAHVEHESYGETSHTFLNMLIIIAPAITTILLFVFSPWYMYPFYIANSNMLWLSADDAQKLVNYYKFKRYGKV